MTELETETLRSGTRLVRPAGTLGTCGWSPKAWQVGVIRMGQLPVAAFLEANPNWSRDEILPPGSAAS